MPKSAEPQTMHPLLKAVLLDLVVFLTLISAVAGLATPLINIMVLEPQTRLERRMERLEAAHEQTRSQISSIDKNLAVLAESTKRTDEALTAIRDYLKTHH